MGPRYLKVLLAFFVGTTGIESFSQVGLVGTEGRFLTLAY
jgi:hypothetical protein